jgi:hypothetical protein
LLVGSKNRCEAVIKDQDGAFYRCVSVTMFLIYRRTRRLKRIAVMSTGVEMSWL